MTTDQQTSTSTGARTCRYDVFLSHHSSDKPLVEMIGARLEDEAGLKPFLDKWHLVPGEPWEEELEEALDQSATCAVFLGPSGLGAWHNEEMRAALDERVRNKSFRVVPVLLPGAEPKDRDTLPRFLRRLMWVDYRAGLDDGEAFHRLVSGIRGIAPGRQPAASLRDAPLPSQVWNQTAAAAEGKPGSLRKKEEKNGLELWKIVVGALVGLVLSASFIAAAIPRYKLQIKSPAFKKDGIYEASAGTVTVMWVITREQWFRETDINGGKANLVIRRIGDKEEKSFHNLSGQFSAPLESGKYEARIEAVEYGRSESIALLITDVPPDAVPKPTTPKDDAEPETRSDEPSPPIASSDKVPLRKDGTEPRPGVKSYRTVESYTRKETRRVPGGVVDEVLRITKVTKYVSDTRTSLPPGKIPGTREEAPRNPVGERSAAAVLLGGTFDQNRNPIPGAKVAIVEVPEVKPVETSIEGNFFIVDVPRKYGSKIKLHIIKEGFQELYTDVVLGGPSPTIILKREK